MKILRSAVLSLVVLGLATISAVAQDEASAPADAPPQQPNPVTFESLDADADGKVTFEEFEANFTPRQMQGRTPQPDRIFGRWDADADGVVTADEFANRPRRRQGQQRPNQ